MKRSQVSFVVGLALGLLVVLLVGTSRTFAQGPEPAGQQPGVQPLSQVDALILPPVNVQKLLVEDQREALTGQPPRFAEPIPVRVSPQSHGTWETLADGRQLWRLQISSPAALSLNLGFTEYRMPTGGQLFLYTPDYSTVVGPFTEADNAAHGQLWTPLLPGDSLVVEVTLPAAAVDQLTLSLTSVNYGYVIFGRASFDKSGSCNVDVVCSQGDPWRDELGSVAVYSLGGIRICTGALVNNTAHDLTPFFLTAHHCMVNAGNAASVVVYWNYENTTCRPPDSAASGQAGDGSLAQFQTGAFFRSAYVPSDFTLLELDEPPSESFDVYWAGWDRSGADASSATAIHHPNTEEKRISFENDPTSVTSYGSATVPGDGTHVRVTDWDLGTTEPGSSGSPLFDQNHRIIGQLHGGGAACGNNESDWYGRLLASWTGGGTDSTRLSNWLDPAGTGANTIDGLDGSGFVLAVTPPTLAVCIPTPAVYSVNVDMLGGFNSPVTLSTTDLPAGTMAGFNPNPLISSGSSSLTINTQNAVTGNYSIGVVGTAATRTLTTTIGLALFDAAPVAATLLTPPNGMSSQALQPTFSWTAVPQAANYKLEVATDPAFSSLAYSVIVTGTTSHTPPADLAAATAYYWRVTAQNTCGVSSPQVASQFQTLHQYCSSPALAIPDNTPAGVTDSLTVTDMGPLLDLDVSIEADHTWVSDLVFTLVHSPTGTSVTLIDQPNVCSGDNIDAVLDDEAGSPVESVCAPAVPTIAGTFSPNNPLSAFDGQDLSGVWRMTVSDHFNPDSGTLTRWCLRPILNLPDLAMTKSVAAAHSPARPGDALTYTLVLSNTGAGSAVDVGVVDTLPAYINGSGLNTTVTVTVGQVIRFTLPASLSLEVPAGLIISNTATYSHPTGGGQASAALVVSATLPPKLVYLPLIRR